MYASQPSSFHVFYHNIRPRRKPSDGTSQQGLNCLYYFGKTAHLTTTLRFPSGSHSWKKTPVDAVLSVSRWVVSTSSASRAARMRWPKGSLHERACNFQSLVVIFQAYNSYNACALNHGKICKHRPSFLEICISRSDQDYSPGTGSFFSPLTKMRAEAERTDYTSEELNNHEKLFLTTG